MNDIIKIIKAIGGAVGYLLITRKVEIEAQLMDVDKRILHPRLREEIKMIDKLLQDIVE